MASSNKHPFRYHIEALLVRFGMWLFGLLPLDIASWLGGMLARLVGPFTKAHKTGLKNLELAMPNYTRAEHKQIMRQVWENLGRTVAEFPYLQSKEMTSRVTLKGKEIVETLKEDGKGAIFVSGHFANWELSPKTAFDHGLPLSLIYRRANNPKVDHIITLNRQSLFNRLYEKGPQGAREMMKSLAKGDHIGMLVDQKMNDGIPLAFFGQQAMTASAPAQLALKYDVPIIPARVVRTKGAHFDVTVYPPLTIEQSGNRRVDVAHLMQKVNDTLEEWIREQPGQWFWVHHRWGKYTDG